MVVLNCKVASYRHLEPRIGRRTSIVSPTATNFALDDHELLLRKFHVFSKCLYEATDSNVNQQCFRHPDFRFDAGIAKVGERGRQRAFIAKISSFFELPLRSDVFALESFVF